MIKEEVHLCLENDVANVRVIRGGVTWPNVPEILYAMLGNGILYIAMRTTNQDTSVP